MHIVHEGGDVCCVCLGTLGVGKEGARCTVAAGHVPSRKAVHTMLVHVRWLHTHSAGPALVQAYTGAHPLLTLFPPDTPLLLPHQHPPVFGKVEACATLEVAHKQVLHRAVGAPRQQHGDGCGVVCIGGGGGSSSSKDRMCQKEGGVASGVFTGRMQLQRQQLWQWPNTTTAPPDTRSCTASGVPSCQRVV
jgi:hypothetical protein